MKRHLKFTKLEKSWILYDVGNSAFTLLISTIIPIYFKSMTDAAGIAASDSTALWSYAASVCTVIVAILGPIFGTLADTKGFKKPLFVLFMMLFNNKIAKYLNKQRKYQDKIAGIFLEELSSLEEMKIYDMQDKYYHYFDTVNKKFCHNYRLKRRYEDVQVNFLQLILDLGEVCIYAVTLYLLF